MRRHWFIYTTLVALCLSAINVHGQDNPKDDPALPPPTPKVEKPPQGFLDAYRSLGSPRLLIYAYMLSMKNTNELGMLKAFEGRLRPYFIHPDVTVAFQNASQFRDQREFEELVAKNSIEAAKLVARESPADYVILVSFIPQGGRQGNVKYTQTYEILDMNRGTMVGTHSWETSPGRRNQDGVVDVRRMEQYAQSLAVKMTNDFIKMADGKTAPSSRNYTLRITGLPDTNAYLARLRSILRNADGVKDVIRPKVDDKSAQFDVKFAGDALDFAEAARQAIEAGLGMNASFRSTDEGLVVVEVWPPTRTPTPNPSETPDASCEVLLNGDPETTANTAERTRFLNAYVKCNEPRIGIMINKEASRQEDERGSGKGATSTGPATGNAGLSQSGQTVICIQCQVAGGSDATPSNGAKPDDRIRTDDDYLNAREMEDRLYRRLGVLRTQRVDLKVAFNNLRAKQRLTREVYDEGELARLLGEEAQAQWVIAGAGRVTHEQSNVTIRYTFRAYEMNSAQIMAAATVNRTINARVGDVNKATEEIAAETLGLLACQIREHCEPPARSKAVMTGVRSAQDVLKVMEAIEKIPGVDRTIFRGVQEGKEKAGVGYFQIVYSCTCRELLDRIIEKKSSLPFDLDANTTCDTIQLKAIDK